MHHFVFPYIHDILYEALHTANKMDNLVVLVPSRVALTRRICVYHSLLTIPLIGKFMGILMLELRSAPGALIIFANCSSVLSSRSRSFRRSLGNSSFFLPNMVT